MRTDTYVELYQMVPGTPDPYGGTTGDALTLIEGIDCLKCPVSVQKLLREHGLVENKTFKLITYQPYPDNVDRLRIGETWYDIVDVNVYGKETVLLVEVRP